MPAVSLVLFCISDKVPAASPVLLCTKNKIPANGPQGLTPDCEWSGSVPRETLRPYEDYPTTLLLRSSIRGLAEITEELGMLHLSRTICVCHENVEFAT